MRKRRMKAALAAGAFLVAFGGSALALNKYPDGPNQNFNLDASTDGANWNGAREWWPDNMSQGAFHYWGGLWDTNAGDGDNVYTKLKIEGYAWESFYGDEAGDGTGDNYEHQDVAMYAPPQQRVVNAQWGVCRDRNVLSDNCTTRSFTRPN